MLESIRWFKKYDKLTQLIENNNINSIFLVSTKSVKKLHSWKYIQKITEEKDIGITKFQDFTPNPTYEDVVKWVNKFNKSKAQLILAIWWWSSIDVAKCIKWFSKMNKKKSYLTQQIKWNDIPFVAIPTTAWTWSEETEFAVIYYKWEKKSVDHKSLKPDFSILDDLNLKTLPTYQRQATVLDAFSHAIESYRSINSTKESETYSLKALKIIIKNKDWYLNNERIANKKMLIASNLAWKAINITKTTAWHAMCYKLTSIYNIAHGHAAALTNSILFPYMIHNLNESNCNDIRWIKFVKNKFQKLNEIFWTDNYINKLIGNLWLYNLNINSNDIDIFSKSVNAQRLKNNPMKLEDNDIKNIYRKLFDTIKAN